MIQKAKKNKNRWSFTSTLLRSTEGNEEVTWQWNGHCWSKIVHRFSQATRQTMTGKIFMHSWHKANFETHTPLPGEAIGFDKSALRCVEPVIGEPCKKISRESQWQRIRNVKSCVLFPKCCGTGECLKKHGIFSLNLLSRHILILSPFAHTNRALLSKLRLSNWWMKSLIHVSNFPSGKITLEILKS